ncbi:hypothetical protein TIFTF001_003087 [Ficus carica]|uniref:NB-ARC domain-containing protein n=1 Tax=Ficus carica TaxID=3494 RepID=A0AA88CTI1_FICCA|nr:hypothetical protein TIFTF001_003087 [Ficus carica]
MPIFCTKKSTTTTSPKEKTNGSDSDKKKNHDGSDQHQKGASRVASTSSSKKDVDDVIRIHWTSTPADDHVNSNPIRGFENERLLLKKLLGEREKDDQFKAVGIVGTRGVGKTTLCQEYYMNDQEKGTRRLLLPRVWVAMAIKPAEKIAMLKRTLASLGVDEEKTIIDVSSHDDDKLLKALLYMLRLQLIQKRYLIVLDGVCEFDPWLEKLHSTEPLERKSGTSLACALPKGCGGTVIVTSRVEETAKKMVGEANVHRVLPLSDPESIWDIFCDTINKLGNGRLTNLNGELTKLNALQKEMEKIRDSCSAEFLLGGKKTDIMADLRKKVIMKCNGLPLTAKLTAETMPDLLDQWKKQHAKQNGQEKDATAKKDQAPYQPKTQGAQEIENIERQAAKVDQEDAESNVEKAIPKDEEEQDVHQEASTPNEV